MYARIRKEARLTDAQQATLLDLAKRRAQPEIVAANAELEARPADNPCLASRFVLRALLTPQANPALRYGHLSAACQSRGPE